MNKRNRIKPRIEGNSRPKMPDAGMEIESYTIASWCPDDDAQEPPEQVHLMINLQSNPFPMVMRFKSPKTIGALVEGLIAYRKEVWPDAESIDPDVTVVEKKDIT